MSVIQPCSGDLSHDVTIVDDGAVTAVVPSNGIQGKRHVPAHTVATDWWREHGVFYWDCPVCGHADSYDPSC